MGRAGDGEPFGCGKVAQSVGTLSSSWSTGACTAPGASGDSIATSGSVGSGCCGLPAPASMATCSVRSSCNWPSSRMRMHKGGMLVCARARLRVPRPSLVGFHSRWLYPTRHWSSANYDAGRRPEKGRNYNCVLEIWNFAKPDNSGISYFLKTWKFRPYMPHTHTHPAPSGRRAFEQLHISGQKLHVLGKSKMRIEWNTVADLKKHLATKEFRGEPCALSEQGFEPTPAGMTYVFRGPSNQPLRQMASWSSRKCLF